MENDVKSRCQAAFYAGATGDIVYLQAIAGAADHVQLQEAV